MVRSYNWKFSRSHHDKDSNPSHEIYWSDYVGVKFRSVLEDRIENNSDEGLTIERQLLKLFTLFIHSIKRNNFVKPPPMQQHSLSEAPKVCWAHESLKSK